MSIRQCVEGSEGRNGHWKNHTRRTAILSNPTTRTGAPATSQAKRNGPYKTIFSLEGALECLYCNFTAFETPEHLT